MANITDKTTYLNFSKYSEYNETLNIDVPTDFNNFIQRYFNIFAQFPILQWFISILTFFAIFIYIRNLTFLNLSDTQVLVLVSYIVIGLNVLLLFLNIFTIFDPLKLFFLLWLGGIIAIELKNT